jgi:hypothetical protein
MPRIDLPDPPPPLRPRRRVTHPASMDLPDLRFDRVHNSDDEAIIPDPPPPRGFYEDGEGPPIQLPP